MVNRRDKIKRETGVIIPCLPEWQAGTDERAEEHHQVKTERELYRCAYEPRQ